MNIKLRAQKANIYKLDQSALDKFVEQTNLSIGELCENLSTFAPPHFGGDMLCNDDVSVVTATISHRVLNKYELPESNRDRELHESCLSGWVEYEEGFLSHHNWRDRFQFNSKTRGIIFKARALLHTWLLGYKNPSFTTAEIEVTPGESLISNRGRTSFYQKLRNRSNWCVTHDAAEDFIRLCYNNLSLKRIAKGFFKTLSREEYSNLYWVKHASASHVGYSVFRERMLDEVLTLVHGSRASSVPKNNEKRRFINVEPLGNMILQRLIAQQIRQVLKQLGNDLEIGQQVHRTRISNPGLSTIDFSNASDSVLLTLLEFMLPAKLFNNLDKYRSPMCLIDGVYYLPKKLSSMGNGFTFEVMTLMLLAISRVLDDCSTVYGDDVIVADEHAYDFIRAAQCAGFTVNKKKTFVQSRFRESCGSFYLDGYGYVECFDFTYCETPNDAIVTMNKFLRIGLLNSVPCADAFIQSYERVLPYVPALLKGPIRDDLPLDGWVAAHSYKRNRMSSKVIRDFTNRVWVKYEQVWRNYQITRSDFCLIQVPVFHAKDASPLHRHITNDYARLAYYYKAGRCARDVVRNDGIWKYHVYVVLPNGRTMSVSYVAEILRNDTTHFPITV